MAELSAFGFWFDAPDGFRSAEAEKPTEPGIYDVITIRGPYYREVKREQRIFTTRWQASDWLILLAFGKKVRDI